jgi:trigger factor
MTVEVEPKREEDLLKKAATRIARQVRIPGFRPGKAPYNVIVRRFGLEAIQQEALEQSLDKLVQDALEEAEVRPVAQIQLDSINWDPLTVKIKIPTRPKVELSDYADIRLESEAVEVGDEDVEEALQELQEQNAIWAPVERPAKIGDLITMAVVEKDGDEILAEQESAEYELVDPAEEQEAEAQEEEQVHPAIDLTTPLLGLSAGDEKTFTITYPEDFDDARYAGKDITFEVKLSSVKEKELDPLDDEFAKSVSDFETLEALKADIRENIRQQRDRQQKVELGNQVLEKIIAASTIEWPLAFEEELIEQEIESFESRAKGYGLTLDRYLQMENKTKEAFQEDIRARLINNLKRTLALGKIAERENIKVSESEILKRAKLISDVSGYGDQIWRNILGSPAQQSLIANDLMGEKVIQWLGAKARGENPSLAEEDELETGETRSEAVEPEVEAGQTTDQAEADAVTPSAGIDESQATENRDSQPEEDQVEAAGESTEEPATAELKS